MFRLLIRHRCGRPSPRMPLVKLLHQFQGQSELYKRKIRLPFLQVKALAAGQNSLHILSGGRVA